MMRNDGASFSMLIFGVYNTQSNRPSHCNFQGVIITPLVGLI